MASSNCGKTRKADKGISADLGHVLVYDMLHSSFSFPYVLPKNLPNKAHNHSMATANLNKSEEFVTNTTVASKYIPRRPRISINWNPTFQTSLHKISKEIFFRLTKFFFRNKKNFSKEQLLFSFLCIVKLLDDFGVIRKFLKIFDFPKSSSRFGPNVEDFNSSWFWLLWGSPFTLW